MNSMPNPASAFCEEKGYTLEIRTAEDGSQSGVCIFPDGSECDEWAYFRGECAPAAEAEGSATEEIPAEAAAGMETAAMPEIPTPLPIDPAGYEGWWTYTQPDFGFSIMLPEDWIVDESATSDPTMNGNTLIFRPEDAAQKQSIRMTFRRVGEEILLWPTGVGEGEFIAQGELEVGGQPAQRKLLVCFAGDVTSIWYYEAEGADHRNITRGDIEFGFIFSAVDHCVAGLSLSGKTQLTGEMIIASLQVPSS